MRSYLSTFLACVFGFLLATPAVLAVPGTWAGYAIVDNAVAANGTVASAVCNVNTTWAANTTIRPGSGEYSASVPQGYYSLSFECTGLVNFYVCGICASVAGQTWSSGPHYNGTTPNFNLSVSKLAAGAACTYSCACTGGSHCCSGATEFTAGEGSGTCQAAACSAATTTTVSGGAGGPGGAATTTTITATTTPTTTTTTVPTTTTIPLPTVEETAVVTSIAAGSTGTFAYTEPTLAVSEISVTTSGAVSSPSVTVSQSSSAPATIAIAAPNTVYGYLTVTKTNVQDADVSSVKVKFKVEKTWVSVNSIDAATIAMQRYANGAWASLPTTKTSEDAAYIYFEATSPGLSVFAISAQKIVTTTTVPQTTTTLPVIVPGVPTEWLIAAVVVIVIVVLLVLWKYTSVLDGLKYSMRYRRYGGGF